MGSSGREDDEDEGDARSRDGSPARRVKSAGDVLLEQSGDAGDAIDGMAPPPGFEHVGPRASKTPRGTSTKTPRMRRGRSAVAQAQDNVEVHVPAGFAGLLRPLKSPSRSGSRSPARRPSPSAARHQGRAQPLSKTDGNEGKDRGGSEHGNRPQASARSSTFPDSRRHRSNRQPSESDVVKPVGFMLQEDPSPVRVSVL